MAMLSDIIDFGRLSSHGARRTAHGARLRPLHKRLLPSLLWLSAVFVL
ncbi:MAG: hypothetical protein ACR2P4_00460 [Gammaproteobacteria bacterium]